jgi:hypothetical protein
MTSTAKRNQLVRNRIPLSHDGSLDTFVRARPAAALKET